MTEKEIIIKKIDTIINFILEEGLQNVSKYSEIHYQKLILLFEKVKKSYLEFMPYVPGVLEEKSYENLSKSYQEMLELTKEAITIFLHKNVSKENGKISLKNIPLQNEKMGDYYELCEMLKIVIGMKNGKNNRLLKKKNYRYKAYEEVSKHLYSTDTSNAVATYNDYNSWPNHLDLNNTLYGYQEGHFYGNALMYALEFQLDYAQYYGLSTLLVEEYDMKRKKDMEREEKATSITVDNVRMICSVVNYNELREMDSALLWKERTALLKFLEETSGEPLLIEAAGGIKVIMKTIEKIDEVLLFHQSRGR